MECDSQQHKEHMCALKEKGDLELIRCLSTNPTVECGNCGAKANKPENLCNPVELPK